MEKDFVEVQDALLAEVLAPPRIMSPCRRLGSAVQKAKALRELRATLPIPAITAVIDTTVEGMPGGSYLRGAPASAGGGGTDGHPSANDQNTGGGGGGNGGVGGYGGYAWSSTTINGGTGGASYSASSSTLFLGGGGGAGTTNNGTADPNNNTTGINSSGSAGGGIAIIHVGSVTGTGTISANGQPTLNVLNDGGGGAGAGGNCSVPCKFWNAERIDSKRKRRRRRRHLGYAAANNTFSRKSSRTRRRRRGRGSTSLRRFGSCQCSRRPERHDDHGQRCLRRYPRDSGHFWYRNHHSQTPGTQPGAECATADLSVTNVGTPNPVSPANNITYTQVVTNSGPIDASNAAFSEAVPANTTFQSISALPAGPA